MLNYDTVEQVVFALQQLANEMYLRGLRYCGPAQGNSWRDIPTSEDELTTLSDKEFVYWSSIARFY